MQNRSAARARARRRRQLRRRRTFTVGGVLLLVVLVVVLVLTTGSGGGKPTSRSGSPSSEPTSRGARARTAAAVPPSIEAGVESWSLPNPVSREAVVANGSGLTVLGGLTPAGSSVAAVSTIDPARGTVAAAGALPDVVHDGAAATLRGRAVMFGGGSPGTFATVQSVPTPSIPPGAKSTGRVGGTLPQPRSDLAVATLTKGSVTTAYLVGGYDGHAYLPDVLATTDGRHFSVAAHLPVPVRYPAVVAAGGLIYAFGGETASPGSTTTATDDIQVIDPATHSARVIGHLPRALYGAAAFLIHGDIYVAGGQVPGGPTLTAIDAFIPKTRRVLDAGWLPQAVAFGGYTTVGSGRTSTGYLVGGEVAGQSGPDAAGEPSGSLTTVISLRPSRYGGAAGSYGAGSPYRGTLLIADRGNDRLLALNPERHITWRYPTATRPAPPGGFYFPDDAFFIRHGTGIISNQEDNHTIVEIGYPSGKLLWQFGHPGTPGSQPGYLDQPDDAYLLKSGVVTVADASNNRILFISRTKRVLEQIGNGLDTHNPPHSIAYPNGDTPLRDGDVLVSEIHGSWIDEYTPKGRLVWTVHLPSVNYPSDPQQLGRDKYLMTDYDPPAEGRILEFDRQGRVLWRYDATAGDAMLKKPSLAERLPDGLIMVNDDYRNRVVVIDPTTDSIVWQYGLTSDKGTAPGWLSIPDGFDLLLRNGTTPTHPNTG